VNAVEVDDLDLELGPDGRAQDSESRATLRTELTSTGVKSEVQSAIRGTGKTRAKVSPLKP
jgi:hypothetical protein